MHVYTLKLPATLHKCVELKKSRLHIKIFWVICQTLIIVGRYQFLKISFPWHVLPIAPALITEKVITACSMFSGNYQIYYVRIYHKQRYFKWKLKNCNCFLWQNLFSLWSPAKVAIWITKNNNNNKKQELFHWFCNGLSIQE